MKANRSLQVSTNRESGMHVRIEPLGEVVSLGPDERLEVVASGGHGDFELVQLDIDLVIYSWPGSVVVYHKMKAHG